MVLEKNETWLELNNNVNKIIKFFKKIKLKKNDRVAAYLPNFIETVEAFLATSSLGAIWSSCSPDFGINGVIERFSQIKPKILFIVDKYFYNGKEINVLERLPQILKKIKSIQYVVVINYPGEKNILNKLEIKKIKTYNWKDLCKIEPVEIKFQNLILSSH